MDLEGLRKYDYSKKINDFISKYKGNLTQHDQTIINVVFQKKIAVWPPKYGIWDWLNMNLAKRHLKIQKSNYKYKSKEFFHAIKYPIIILI